jgi:copper chaperone CopZ
LVLEFEALHVPALTEEVAINLEQFLTQIPGIVQLQINVESRALQIRFDEARVDFLQLTQVMAQAGCPLRQIDAALLKKLSG